MLKLGVCILLNVSTTVALHEDRVEVPVPPGNPIVIGAPPPHPGNNINSDIIVNNNSISSILLGLLLLFIHTSINARLISHNPFITVVTRDYMFYSILRF